jgi:hypothetical protein
MTTARFSGWMVPMTEMDWDRARHRSLLQLRAYHRTAISGSGLSIEYSVKALKAFSDILSLHEKHMDDLSDYPAERCLACDAFWPCETVKVVLAFCGHNVADSPNEV